MPLNCASDAPLVKNVPAVPFGPTKVNGPLALLLAAAWNCSVVPEGTSAFHEIVLQFGVRPAAAREGAGDDPVAVRRIQEIKDKLAKPINIQLGGNMPPSE